MVVHGRLVQRSWQNQQGENRYKTEFRAESVFASLAEVATSDAPPNAGMGGGAASAPGAPPF